MATLSICWNPLRNIGSYVRAENLVGCDHPQQRRSTATRTANHPPGGSAKPLIAGFPHISTMRVHAGMGEVRWMNGFYARRWIVGKKRIHRGERAKKEAWCVEKRTMERKRVCTAASEELAEWSSSVSEWAAIKPFNQRTSLWRAPIIERRKRYVSNALVTPMRPGHLENLRHSFTRYLLHPRNSSSLLFLREKNTKKRTMFNLLWPIHDDAELHTIWTCETDDYLRMGKKVWGEETMAALKKPRVQS